MSPSSYTMFPRLSMILKGGQVVRFHTKPTIKEETVAEHSYLVAWLITLVHPGTPRAELLLAALAHDLPEYILGDVPSPTKIALGLGSLYRTQEALLFERAGMPDYEGMLNETEAAILKFCDNLAGYLKCRYEQQLGNRTLRTVVVNYRAYIENQIATSPHLPKDVCAVLMGYAELDILTMEDTTNEYPTKSQ